MYSYPNLVPLPASKVEEIAAKVESLQFNRLYNAFVVKKMPAKQFSVLPYAISRR
nr:hypothetical protein [Bacillus tequilensis]